MKQLITEAREILAREIAAERKAGAKITDEDVAEACDEIDLSRLSPERKAYFCGWLRGCAEAQDLTVTELLETP